MSTLKTYCNTCNLWLNSQDQLVAHQSGKSHRRRETFGVVTTTQRLTEGLKITDLSRSFVNQENGSNITNQPLNANESSIIKRENISGQNDASSSKTTKGDEYFCNICVVRLTSKSQADMHYDGAKHKKSLAVMAGKLGEIQHDGVTRKMGDFCGICNVPLSSKAVADAHYTGSRHDKKLKLAQTIRGSLGSAYSGDKIQPTSYALSVVTSASTQIASSSSVLMVPVPTGSVGQQQVGLAGGFLYCSFCGVSVNSQQQMEAHWQGAKHKSHVNGILSQPKSSFTSRPAVNQNRYYNPGHIYTHGNYTSSNGQAAFRTRLSVPYVSHQY